MTQSRPTTTSQVSRKSEIHSATRRSPFAECFLNCASSLKSSLLLRSDLCLDIKGKVLKKGCLNFFRTQRFEHGQKKICFCIILQFLAEVHSRNILYSVHTQILLPILIHFDTSASSTSSTSSQYRAMSIYLTCPYSRYASHSIHHCQAGLTSLKG